MHKFFCLNTPAHILDFPGLALLASALFLFTLFSPAGPAAARVEKAQIVMSNGTEIKFSVVVPDQYDGQEPLPAILALPGGDQQSQKVAWGLKHYWQATAEARGYLVISPQSPGYTFIEGSEVYLAEFIERMKIRFKIRNDRFHLVGIGVGGMSAFRVAALEPDQFESILGIPGYFWAPSEEKYQALRGKCVIQIAGAPEINWADGARRDHAKFQEMGMNPYLEILPGKVHWRSPYIDEGAEKLFDMIENKVGC